MTGESKRDGSHPPRGEAAVVPPHVEGGGSPPARSAGPVRDAVAKESSPRAASSKEVPGKETGAKEAVAKEPPGKEAPAREPKGKDGSGSAKETPARLPAARESAGKESAAKELAAREAAAREPAARESAAKETTAKESAAKEPPAKQPVAREAVEKEAPAKEAAAKEPAAKESATKESAAKESAAKEPAAKEPAIKEPTSAVEAAAKETTEEVRIPAFESSADDQIALELLNQRICDFDMRLEGRPLGKVVERFLKELRTRGITKLAPRFYMTDEWGVPEGTVAIGIPFYLADERLKRVQKIRGGRVEGTTVEDILRYLRHEMGHVVNYAYGLYTSEEWTRLFGPMARPYIEDYKALPFSPEFVRHLPGGYAQKHPDEDWAETFAVWLTPKLNWRELYADCPGAMQKLEYCDRMMQQLKDKDPITTVADLDVEASTMSITVKEYYDQIQLGETTISRSLDGDLQVIFAHDLSPDEGSARLGIAVSLLKRHCDALAETVYRWSGIGPDLIRELVLHLARRAEEMHLVYKLSERDTILIELSGFLTTLAMNYVYKGNFIAK